jgi:hypothetical protein
MGEAQRPTFRVLTSNSTRLRQLSPQLPWKRDIWAGVTVESQSHTYRIQQPRKTGAQVKSLSFEPLLEPVGKLDLSGINRVIVGRGTGPGARPLNPDWVREIHEQWIAQNVEFALKQSNGWSSTADSDRLDDRTSDETPEPPTALDLDILAEIENNPAEPPPVPLAGLPEQTVPARIWAFLRSYPGIAVALIALLVVWMMIQGLWIKPVPPATLLKDSAAVAMIASFSALAIHHITQRR